MKKYILFTLIFLFIFSFHPAKTFASETSQWIKQNFFVLDAKHSDDWITEVSSFDGKMLAAFFNSSSPHSIYTSINGGISWVEQKGSGLKFWTQLSLSSDGLHLVALDYDPTSVSQTKNNLYISSDGGISWIQPTSITENFSRIVISPDGKKIVGATSYNGQQPGSVLYTSDDGGLTWQHQIDPSVPFGVASIAVSFDGTHIAVAGKGVSTSVDGGVTWKHHDISGENFTSIASDSSGQKLFALSSTTSRTVGGYIFTSFDGGQTWEKRISPHDTNAVLHASYDGMHIIESGVTTPNTSVDGGVTWTKENNYYWMESSAISGNGKKLFASMSDGYLYTKDLPYPNEIIQDKSTIKKDDITQKTFIATSTDVASSTIVSESSNQITSSSTNLSNSLQQNDSQNQETKPAEIQKSENNFPINILYFLIILLLLLIILFLLRKLRKNKNNLQ